MPRLGQRRDLDQERQGRAYRRLRRTRRWPGLEMLFSIHGKSPAAAIGMQIVTQRLFSLKGRLTRRAIGQWPRITRIDRGSGKLERP